MLKEGERSADFKMLPPGPNNPVGVMWIALNKRGIGLHGTDDPDAVGRGASHGCVRLANWDIVRLAGKVKTGTPFRFSSVSARDSDVCQSVGGTSRPHSSTGSAIVSVAQ